MKEKFIACDCGVEVLRLTYDPDDKDWGLCISILDVHHNLGIRDKLRWIWEILRNRTPFGDAIILNPIGVQNLLDFGEEYLNQRNKEIETK
jgi:hypothetical protein